MKKVNSKKNVKKLEKSKTTSNKNNTSKQVVKKSNKLIKNKKEVISPKIEKPIKIKEIDESKLRIPASQKIFDKILDLNSKGIDKLLKLKTDYILGLISKGEVNKFEEEYKNNILPELNKCYEESKNIDNINALQYALFNGATWIMPSIFQEGVLLELSTKLEELREPGEYEVSKIQDYIKTLMLRKNLSKEDKQSQIQELKKKLVVAKTIEKKNKEEVKKLQNQATQIASLYGKEVSKFSKLYNRFLINTANAYRDYRLKEEKERFLKVKSETEKSNIQFVISKHESIVNEINRDASDVTIACKDDINDAYITKYNYYRLVRNNRLNIAQNLEHYGKNYAHQFTLSNFLLRNALYFVIIAFFLTCVIISSIQGNKLLSKDTIVTILSQSSTKMFFSLGVAGLILLGGTDLSIGRMTGMVATFSCMFLSKAAWTTNFGKIDFSGLSTPIAIILGILVCIAVATLFSSLAGFFTAKFKMHPFITTLSTQLLIFGIMMICFSQVSAFKMDETIKSGIVGTSGWQLILYAGIAVVIMWFIWNKTKFGRHMYAVGDNKEAAKVSGINVFAITMGVFILAGVCYGLGGFFEGARIGSANPSLGLGTELDAIAACVIGGISFSGGRGKIGGAVIGTIIFTTLTYCLTFLGLDSNYQYIFKGLIILAAVCLDSLKFLEKK